MSSSITSAVLQLQLLVGVLEALLVALDGAAPARGGFGRPLRLLLRHCLASVAALLGAAEPAGGAARQRCEAAGAPALMLRVRARAELQPPAPVDGGAAGGGLFGGGRGLDRGMGMFMAERAPAGDADLRTLVAEVERRLRCV